MFRPTDSQGEAAAGRTQLLMDGDTVTSGAYESSSSSAEEEAARADPELEDIKYQLLEAALTHVVSHLPRSCKLSNRSI